MEKQQLDYGHPSIFFGILIFLSFISYHLSQLLDMNSIIIFIIWFIITTYIFISIRKKGLAANHPATFFALIITFSITGYYIESVLNIEIYMMLLAWLVLAGFTLHWMKNNPKADKRLFYLLGAQFLALAFLIPLFIQLAQGPAICIEHVAATHNHEGQFADSLLAAFKYVMVFTSIFVAIKAVRKASHTSIYPTSSESV